MEREIPFTASRGLQRVVARHDSDLMARFRAVGLVTLGLTSLLELAMVAVAGTVMSARFSDGVVASDR
ncbi:hypothetical protein AB0L06_35890 [Spirillospora sp. NPDC052269]